MLKITVISVGKLKEKYLQQGIAEYAKRLGSYCSFSVIEVPDEPTSETNSDKENEAILAKEGERILAKISDRQYVIALAIEGKLVSSPDLADILEHAAVSGQSQVTFIIGGSLGLSPAVMKRADAAISLGKITLPHQLARLVLSEQIYRAFRIANGHAYHK